MPAKTAYVHTIVKKLSDENFPLLPAPNPKLKSSQLSVDNKRKYDALFNVFSENTEMMKKYNIDGTKIKGKKALVGWVGENKNYEKLRQYVLDNYTDLATVSSYLGALANILIGINKNKFRQIASDLHIGA